MAKCQLEALDRFQHGVRVQKTEGKYIDQVRGTRRRAASKGYCGVSSWIGRISAPQGLANTPLYKG